MGIFFITSINPITSVLVKKYETIKGNYERDKEYLAAITENGIWIKEKNLEKNNIIRSSHLENESLLNVTIYEFDKDNNFIKRIQADRADIGSLKWSLSNAKIIDPDGKIIPQSSEKLSYISMSDIKKIKDKLTKKKEEPLSKADQYKALMKKQKDADFYRKQYIFFRF